MNRIRRTLARGARPVGTGEPHSRQRTGEEPQEIVRVTKMGGKVLDQELIWRHDPDPSRSRSSSGLPG